MIDMNNRKRLIILGATSETCKLVQKAESMGVETFVADPYQNAPAKKYSSHPILVDCFDVEKICKIVIDEKIDGVLPGCADILVPVYEEVCRKLNKHCYVNKMLVETFNNKKGLKAILVKHGLRVIKEFKKEEIDNDSFDSFPLFVKPVDNNSSKGMYIINDKKEFEILYQKALSFSRSKTVLIEEYKRSDDFFIGYYIENGNVKVAFTGDRFIIEQPGVGSITSGIVYPSKYQDLYFERIHEKMLGIFRELNFENGICAIQGFVENGEIMFYDPALRITGGQEYILVNHFTGVDELESLINYALYGKMSDNSIYKKCDCSFSGGFGCNLAFSVFPCVIGRIDGIDYARNHKGVINVTQEHNEGDTIDKIGTAQQNFARMHIFANSREEMRDLIIDLQKHVVAYDAFGNNVMLKGLDAEKWYNSR